MDGRGDKGADFFGRIKNYNVMLSPHPRHLGHSTRPPGMAPSMRPLAGGGGGIPMQGPMHPPGMRPPAMAQSMRPLVRGGAYAQGPARPLPTHAQPAWASPVARPGRFGVSPTGGGARGGHFVRSPQGAGMYRASPEYPVSVQPIRARQHAVGDHRHIPGSTFPVHAGAPELQGLSPDPGPCDLHGWFASIDTDRMGVTVSGYINKPDGRRVLRHSGPIERLHSARVLLSTSGMAYRLVGEPDLVEMRRRGFPGHMVSQFEDGFPHDWRVLVDSHLEAVAGVRPRSFSFSPMRDDAPRAELPSPPAASALDGSCYGRPNSARFEAISEESETPTAQPRTSSRPLGYRSGSDLFHSGRFAPGNMGRALDRLGAGRARPRPRSPAIDKPDLPVNYDSDDDHSALPSPELGSTGVYRPPLTRDDSELAAAISRMPLETPARSATESTMQPSSDGHMSSTSPELTMGRAAEWVGLGVGAEDDGPNDADVDPLRLDSGVQDTASESGSGHSSSELSSLEPPPRAGPGAKRKPQRVSRRVVESSDESASAAPSAAEDSDSEAASSTLSSVAHIAAEAAPKSTKKLVKSITRIVRGPPPVTPRTKRAPKTPKSAPAGRAKGAALRTPARRLSRGAPSDGAAETPTKAPFKPPPPLPRVGARARRSTIPAGPMVVVEARTGPKTPSTAKPTPEHAATPAAKPAAKPTVTATATATTTPMATPKRQPPKRSPSQESSTHTDSDQAPHSSDAGAAADHKKTPAKPKRRQSGARFFRYTEPETPSSVTRSGRKVRPPQEWWANAQEHLASTPHPEPSIRYRWGTGDAVVIKDGKRMRLSDVVLEDIGAEHPPAAQSSDGDSDSD
ncbi:hypothetical protein H4R18_000690 [Coemansia javaensis]|uniref:SANTA domain-containing protein n=1 Tax=Coemansia javaensis TaxID=2761396 RepID=A0A9W8LLE5_9FUNG|nr:hypothetical protein H4R18_000690 [Coemansia javaensis]